MWILPSYLSASCLWSSALEKSPESLPYLSALPPRFPTPRRLPSYCPSLSSSSADASWWKQAEQITRGKREKQGQKIVGNNVPLHPHLWPKAAKIWGGGGCLTIWQVRAVEGWTWQNTLEGVLCYQTSTSFKSCKFPHTGLIFHRYSTDAQSDRGVGTLDGNLVP